MGPLKLYMLCVVALFPNLNVAQETAVPQLDSEEVQFQSGDITLSGTLFFPPSERPEAVVVFIHGSGEAARMSRLAQAYASNGLAVLTYDKRGAGKSGGTLGKSGSNESLNELAQDASAGFGFVIKHHRLQDIPAGFVGVSQGGWIAPMAAVRSPATAFIGILSGPVCTTAEEIHFSNLAEGTPDFFKKYTAQDIATYMNVVPDIPGFDVDPSVSLSQLSIPGLWLFGSEDDSIPVELSVQRLEALIQNGHTYQYKIFPGLGHSIGRSDDPRNPYMVNWIKVLFRVRLQ